MKNTARVDLEKSRVTLKEKLLDLMPEAGEYFAPFGGAVLHRVHTTMNARPTVLKPVVVVIAQGEKCVRTEQAEYIYGESSYFIVGVDMPSTCAMKETSPENPFLSMVLDLDRGLIAQIAAEIPPTPGSHDAASGGAMVADLDSDLIDAFLRLVELVERPEQAAMLAPLVIKEIHYRLIAGPYGNQLRAINTVGTLSNQIAQAVGWLRDNYKQPLQVDELARLVNMGTSTFHKHFKWITSLSPLQYQKRLRLEEAQRLMLTQGFDASSACVAVGYENMAQFNREYKRLYGDPPRRDIVRMKQTVGEHGHTAYA